MNSTRSKRVKNPEINRLYRDPKLSLNNFYSEPHGFSQKEDLGFTVEISLNRPDSSMSKESESIFQKTTITPSSPLKRKKTSAFRNEKTESRLSRPSTKSGSRLSKASRIISPEPLANALSQSTVIAQENLKNTDELEHCPSQKRVEEFSPLQEAKKMLKIHKASSRNLKRSAELSTKEVTKLKNLSLSPLSKEQALRTFVHSEERKQQSWRRNTERVYKDLQYCSNIVHAREPAIYDYPTFRLIDPPVAKHVPIRARKKFNQFDPKTIKDSTDFFSHMSDIAIRKTKYRVPHSHSIFSARAKAPRFDEADQFPQKKERERFVTIDYATLPTTRVAHPVLQYSEKLFKTKCGELKDKRAIQERILQEIRDKKMAMNYNPDSDNVSIEVSTDVYSIQSDSDGTPKPPVRRKKVIKIPKMLKQARDKAREMEKLQKQQQSKYDEEVSAEKERLKYMPKILNIAKTERFHFYRYEQIQREAQKKRDLHLKIELAKLEEMRKEKEEAKKQHQSQLLSWVASHPRLYR